MLKNNSMSRLTTFGIIGSVGMFLGIIADLATGYLASYNQPLSSNILNNVYKIMIFKPIWQLILGHYLAIIGLSLGLFGLWHVYQVIRPASEKLSFWALILGIFAYICGIVFHTQFAFLTISDWHFIWPVAGLFLSSMIASLIIVFYLINSGKTLYPRKINIVNPLVLIILFWLATLISPAKMQILLLFIVYNTAFCLFYLSSVVTLWKKL